MLYLTYFILILFLFIAQSFFPELSLFNGLKPDFLLIIVVIVAINYGKRRGALIGLLTGLLEDLFFGGLIGVNAVSKLVVGFLLGFLNKYIYQYIFILIPVFVFLATIINQLIIIALLNSILLETTLVYLFNNFILPFSAANTLFSIPLYCIFYIIDVFINRRSSSVK